MSRICAFLVVVSFSAAAQSTSSIQASGSATIGGIAPDQVQLSVGVVTAAATAQDAASQNATQATAMINALKAVLGSSGTIQTVGYSISPRYSGGTNGAPPEITGYTANNTVQVTTANLNLVGPLIDAANRAGANSINGPSYSLQNSDPYTQQALSAAAKQALAHASAIAAGLGAKTGAVISAQEGANVVPFLAAAAGTNGTPTPIQTGTVSVSATVTVTVAMVQ
jgi:uncharacterized protein